MKYYNVFVRIVCFVDIDVDKKSYVMLLAFHALVFVNSMLLSCCAVSRLGGCVGVFYLGEHRSM